MTDEEYVLDRISRLRPTAKFVVYSHSRDFIQPVPDVDINFHYVNLYDEQIDANLIKSQRGFLLIHNTYLSSFAYNLFLCWLYSVTLPAGDRALSRRALLKHNFKKFFAEQLIHIGNSVAFRALFLETLLYEQKMMVPVFEARSLSPDLDSRAKAAADLMSSLVSTHELGHFFFGNKPGAWETFIEHNPTSVKALFDRVSKTFPAAFVAEFQCDAFAAISVANLYAERAGGEFSLQATVFAFAAFAVLFSLARSAQKTAQNQTGLHDEVDLKSLEKVHRDFVFSVGIDRDFVVRAQLVTELCLGLASQKKFVVFGTGQQLNLPETITEDLLAFIDTLIDNDDDNARNMSLLVADSLQGNDEGFQYLYLRSKTFTTNRVGKLQV